VKKIVVVLLCFVGSLWAQEKLKKPLLERMIEPRVSVESSYLSDADVDGGGGVEVFKNRVRINNKIAGISYTNWRFNWSDISALPFGDGKTKPIEEMHSFKLNLNLPYFINEKWFFLAQTSFNATYEKETSDAFGAGIFSFLSYKFNEDHTYQFGAFANYHPIKTLALPVISYSYRSQQRDGLQVVLGFPRTFIGYHVNEKTLLRFGAIFSQSVIKLSNTSALEPRGYVEAKDYMSNVGIAYELDDSLQLESDILYSLKREFNLYNSAGEKGNSYSIKPSLGINVRVAYRF
jgi:hypothetical protein